MRNFWLVVGLLGQVGVFSLGAEDVREFHLKLPNELVNPLPVAGAGTQLLGRTFRLLPLEDGRELADPGEIGVSRTGGGAVKVRVKEPVLPYVSVLLAKFFPRFGVTLFDHSPDYLISGKLRRFFVTEDQGAMSEVTLHLVVSTVRGDMIWEGDVTGSVVREGKPLKAGTYNLVLGEGILRAMLQFVKSEQLQQAVASGKSIGPAPGLSPAAEGNSQAKAGTVDPAKMLEDLVRLNKAGTTVDLMIRFLGQRPLSRALTAEDLIAWQQAGLPSEVIRAALDGSRPSR